MGFGKNTLFVSAAVVLTGLALSAITRTEAVRAQDETSAGAAGSEHAFVGSKGCRKCHSATYKSWEKLSHGKALETLKPGVASEAKTKFNLDPAKDYTTDEKCLTCHTTGFGKEGGYAVPDSSDKKAVRRAAKLAGVGCESCHGPGDDYNKVFKEILTSKRMYKVEELTAVGLQEVTEQTCAQCHNADSPTHDASVKFDFEEMKKKGVHEHVELKQRDG